MQSLANVHPIRDDVRNIESALCHGTKETKVREIENLVDSLTFILSSHDEMR